MKVSIIAGNYAHSEDGIGRYTKNLIEGIEKYSKNVDLEVVGFDRKIHSKKVSSRSRSIGHIGRLLNPIRLEVGYFSRFYKNNYVLSKSMQDTESDIYHAVSPSEAVSALKLIRRPLITTFHDIIPLLFKNRYLMEESYFLYYSHMANKSEKIIADSHNTKNDLVERLNIQENKIQVIYPGINTDFFYPAEQKDRKIKNILYLGGLIKRKGVHEVIYSFKKLLEVRDDIYLTIGGSGEEYDNIQVLLHKLKINARVSMLGHVVDEDIPALYHSADIFVYPSKYEGFGYTPLEAMASGVPVITSNTSSLPELVQDAAMRVDPVDVEGIACAMNKILEDKLLANKLRHDGIERAKAFSWKSCASQTSMLYQSLA